MIVKLMVDVYRPREGSPVRFTRTVEWVDGLPFPQAVGDMIVLSAGEDQQTVQVDWIEYHPEGIPVAAVIHCASLMTAIDLPNDTEDEYMDRTHPGWEK